METCFYYGYVRFSSFICEIEVSGQQVFFSTNVAKQMIKENLSFMIKIHKRPMGHIAYLKNKK